ncbi:MAG: sialidase family protein [Gemmatimonadales bacterium]
MDRRGPRALALVVLFAACARGAPVPQPSTTEVAAPAGPDSGEPFLVASAGPTGEPTAYLSWLERVGEGVHELRLASFDGSGWSSPSVIERSSAIMANWADFPSVAVAADGALWAHWLERGGEGGYGIRIARSSDRGVTWSEPWTPHEDASATEHGFVAAIPLGEGPVGGMAFAWLDGRAFASTGASAREETALYFRVMGADGPSSPETPIDPRACDCCQVDAATAATGPVLVYRDRSPQEIRDIHVVRWSRGAWTDPRPVHVDGWETGACPVNGPAVDAAGDRVVVAWFTAAAGSPRVKVAFSDDSAESFDEARVVDDGDPAGRVDVVLLEDGSALVSWLERAEGDASEVRVRRVAPDGRTSPSARVSVGLGERAGGVSRMARLGDGALVAWTDASETVTRVRVALVEVE